MRLRRPYIPIAVRLEVATRQWMFGNHPVPRGHDSLRLNWEFKRLKGNGRRLRFLLKYMFERPQLDHDPALENRKCNAVTGKYTPDANDPRYLVYREKEDHGFKTTGRRPGAERTVTSKGSDNWIAKKFRKLEGKPRRKTKIPSRPFHRRKK